MATAIVESNHGRSDSIPLDNTSGDKTNEVTIRCNHFSIRGYVAELRVRDPKFCDPFSPYGVHEGSTKPSRELPPMMVPKFRWWKCGGCVPGTRKEAHKSADDKLIHPSEHFTVKESKLDPPGRGRNAGDVIASDFNDSTNYLQSATGSSDQKEKGKAHVEDELVAPQAVELGSECKENGIAKFHQKKIISNGIKTGASEEENYLNHDGGQECVVSLPDLNECNRAPSNDRDENEVSVSGNHDVCEEEDDYLGVDRRKAPKVRLLSELLGLKETHNVPKLKKRNNPSFSGSSGSKSESEDESTEIKSKPWVKKCTKSSPDKNTLLEERKNKKIKITPKLSNEKGKCPETNNVTTDASGVKECQEVQSDKEIGIPRKSDVSAAMNEKISANDQILVTPGKDGVSPLPSLAEPMITDNSVVRKHTVNTSVRETSLGFRTAGGVSVITRERSNLAQKNSKGKQDWIPQTEEGSPLVQHNLQVSSSIMSQKELMKCIQDIDINSIPTDDKVPGQNKADDQDIPMDIVELLAKNQHERNLSDSKDKHHPFSLPENVRSWGSHITYEEQMPKQKQPQFSSWQNPYPRDARDGVINGFEAPNSSKHRFSGPFSDFNRTHISFRGHLTFNQRQELSFRQTTDSYNKFRASFSSPSSSPRMNTGPHLWPPVMSRNKGKTHHQVPGILNFSAADLGKQNMNFSNSYNSGNKKLASYPPKPMGSADSYSNEVVPAMNLLSLKRNAGKPELHQRAPNFPDYQQYYQRDPVVPARPTICSFASSFQISNGGIGKNSWSLTPGPLTSSHGVHRPQKPISCKVGRKRELGSAFNKGKASGMPSPSSFTNPFQDTNDSAKKPYGLAIKRDEMIIGPNPPKEICRVNQNPSDFNDLKELRKYMIKPEDLRQRETRHEKSARRGKAKRQEMRMNKDIPCILKNITGEVSAV